MFSFFWFLNTRRKIKEASKKRTVWSTKEKFAILKYLIPHVKKPTKKQIVLKAKSKTDDLNKRKWKSIKFHAWAMFQTCSRSFKASKFTSIKSRELYPKYFSAIVVDIDYRLSNIVLYDQLLDGSKSILVESDIKSVFGIYFWYRCNVTSIL